MTDQLDIPGMPSISLTASRYVFGREAGCDIVLTTNDGTVSRQHAALEQSGQGQWVVVDLNSTNGVYVNGQKITGQQALTNGDKIGIGDNQLTLQISQNQTMMATSVAAYPHVSPPAQPLAPAVPQGIYCQKCGGQNALAAAFCSGCGNSLNASSGSVPNQSGAMPQQNQNVNVNVVNKGNNSGWWAAAALLLFGTPIGCVAIPAFFVLLFVLFATGITFMPMVIAAIAALVVWKYEGIDPTQKTTIVACIIGGGIVLQILIFASLAR